MEAAYQKICDIKQLLTSCAELLAGSSAGALQTTQIRGTEQKLTSKVATDAADLSLPAPEPCPSDDKSALRDGCEKLVHYIVRLESELGYYKHLCDNKSVQEIRPHLAGEEQSVAPAGKTDSQSEPKEAVQNENLNEDDESRVLFLVFCHLSTIDLCRMSLVCRKWRQIAAHPLLWRRVCVDNALLPPNALQTIATRCPKCDTLRLQGLMPVMALCDEDLHTYITRVKGCLEPPLALLMSVSGPSLRHIHLVDCDLLITERSLWLLSMHCPNLLEVTYSSEAFPPTKEALWALSNGCPLIRQLNLPPVNSSSDLRQLEDSCLEQIANGWPGLLQLSVGGPSITYKALALLVYSCSGLQSLELTECPPIDTEVVSQLCKDGRLSSLHTLTLMFTRVTPQAVVSIIENCGSLVSFDLYISSAMYFSGTGPQAVYKYLTVLENLKELDGHPSLRNAFHLHHIDY